MTDTTNPQADRAADRAALAEGPQTVSHNANELRRKLATAERIRENADFHLGQEMARRQLAEKETARLWAVVARLRQMTDHWEQQLPEVIRTPAVVSAIRAALEAADGPSRVVAEAQQPTGCDHDSQVIDHEGHQYWACLKCGQNLGKVADEAQQPETRKACGCGQDGCEYCDVDDDAAEAQQPETQADDRAAIIAEILPAWEAVYEPGNASDYLVGYANDEAPAKAAAEAWMRSQAEVTGRLEWVPEERLATGRYDQWFELIERHDGGIDTGPGLIVRRRVADEARVGAGERR